MSHVVARLERVARRIEPHDRVVADHFRTAVEVDCNSIGRRVLTEVDGSISKHERQTVNHDRHIDTVRTVLVAELHLSDQAECLRLSH